MKKNLHKNFKKIFLNKKVLITGHTGFKGSWLSLWMHNMGAKVMGISRDVPTKPSHSSLIGLEKIIISKKVDIQNSIQLKNTIKKFNPDFIFHLAAQAIVKKSYLNPIETWKTNLIGTVNILESVRYLKKETIIVLITSDKVYKNLEVTRGYNENDTLGGLDPYGASKSAAEISIKSYIKSFFSNKKNKIFIATARAGNVIGGGDWSTKRLIPDAIRSLIKKKKILIRNPNFNRPWQLVLEPLKGYLILAKKQFEKPKTFSGAWNFGTNPKNVTDVRTIVKYIIEFWGSGNITTKKNNFYEQVNLQLNSTKAKNLLKWKSTYSIKSGAKMTTEWYKRVYKNKQKPSSVTKDQIKQYMHDSKIN